MKRGRAARACNVDSHRGRIGSSKLTKIAINIRRLAGSPNSFAVPTVRLRLIFAYDDLSFLTVVSQQFFRPSQPRHPNHEFCYTKRRDDAVDGDDRWTSSPEDRF